jgi:AcrR family transcriptional regulator
MNGEEQAAQGQRRRLTAEERRESILDAANHVFGEHGF